MLTAVLPADRHDTAPQESSKASGQVAVPNRDTEVLAEDSCHDEAAAI